MSLHPLQLAPSEFHIFAPCQRLLHLFEQEVQHPQRAAARQPTLFKLCNQVRSAPKVLSFALLPRRLAHRPSLCDHAPFRLCESSHSTTPELRSHDHNDREIRTCLLERKERRSLLIRIAKTAIPRAKSHRRTRETFGVPRAPFIELGHAALPKSIGGRNLGAKALRTYREFPTQHLIFTQNRYAPGNRNLRNTRFFTQNCCAREERDPHNTPLCARNCSDSPPLFLRCSQRRRQTRSNIARSISHP